jgi:GT2 family glycosyltransferase
MNIEHEILLNDLYFMSHVAHWSAFLVADDPLATLPEALRALEASGPSLAVTVVDNAPSGIERPHLAWPGLRWLRNPRPQTVGRSYNQALGLELAHAKGELDRRYALFLTPDVIVGTDSIPKMEALLEAEPLLGAVGPKLRRAHIAGSLDGERHDIEFTETLDSIGLAFNLLGRPTHLGRGEPDNGQLILRKPPFAPSPACFAVRLSALRALSSQGPWFQEEGDWAKVALGCFRRLEGSEYRLTVATDAVSWRLAPRV